MRLSVCPKVDTLVSEGASERAAPGGIVEGRWSKRNDMTQP